MIAWDVPGPYAVGFTTREGGVSEGPFDSLNLGGRGDDPARVAENRRRVCDRLGVDAARLAVSRQLHSQRVQRAQDGVSDQVGDGLWTDEPGLPMLAVTADCVPIALASTDGPPALAVLHAGWRGLAAGIAEAGVRALGAGETAAIVGPAVGPCCYEVGPDVSARFDPDLTNGAMLDLWEAAERSLRRAGVVSISRVDICTRCHPDLFFSYRRDGERCGAQGVIGVITC